MCVGDGACGPGAHRRAQGPRPARPQSCPSAWGRQAPWAASRQGRTVTICGSERSGETHAAHHAPGRRRARSRQEPCPHPRPQARVQGEEAAAAPQGWCPRPSPLEWSQGGAVALLGSATMAPPSPGRGWRPEGPPPQGPLTPLPITSQVSQTYAKPLTGSPGVGENPPPRRRGTRLRSIREGL